MTKRKFENIENCEIFLTWDAGLKLSPYRKGKEWQYTFTLCLNQHCDDKKAKD